jgi:hypothetical protein
MHVTQFVTFEKHQLMCPSFDHDLRFWMHSICIHNGHIHWPLLPLQLQVELPQQVDQNDLADRGSKESPWALLFTRPHVHICERGSRRLKSALVVCRVDTHSLPAKAIESFGVGYVGVGERHWAAGKGDMSAHGNYHASRKLEGFHDCAIAGYCSKLAAVDMKVSATYEW